MDYPRADPGSAGDVHADQRAAARRRADALGLFAERALADGLNGSRTERYQVVVHLAEGGAHLDDGAAVTAVWGIHLWKPDQPPNGSWGAFGRRRVA
jgi:hypothetical protein